MMRAILTVGLLGAATASIATDAEALTCARGPYRTGCVSPHGAAVYGRRGGAVYRPGGGAVVYGRGSGASVHGGRGGAVHVGGSGAAVRGGAGGAYVYRR